ncbi:zinc-dependent alcohol dehydrogenase family protein [Pseudomaricurvus hydrocarbonicus]|nr:zinc-dependent alcohol dehydrogenase family protein [Aestuariicella hydrocarbonica]
MALTQLADVVPGSQPLQWLDFPNPVPDQSQVLMKVVACGVCHTELDEIEGRLPPSQLPRILGHQAVGEVIAIGDKVTSLRIGDRVGVGWIAKACGTCEYCRSDRENLCPQFEGTGLDIHGGYAEQMVIEADFAHPMPDSLSSIQAAPLLCAGAIGYRALRLANLHNGAALGLTGFGGSAHLVLQMARHLYPDSAIHVFARDEDTRQFARSLGADWVGDTSDTSASPLHAIIDTTPAWLPVVSAMSRLAPGGRLVINAIRKEVGDQNAWLKLDYPRDLWQEKEIKSVANVTRRDIREFLALAAEINIQPEVECFELRDANRALVALKTQRVRGSKVLVID